ncbi:MAG: citrate/2-methylcitrate synthase [Clostridia bacterium]|nr:citrate/2-methylcitrate synthase [Clostridia bacterium]
MSSNNEPLSQENIEFLVSNIKKVNAIDEKNFEKYGVKRGLRNADGTGVMAGLTRVCSVNGYYLNDGEKVPHEGRLYYRGFNVSRIVRSAQEDKRFGFEEVAWLLIFGFLPDRTQLETFREILGKCRDLPKGFSEDMIMKNPSKDIMNMLARLVLALYSYDDNPDDTSVENVIRQSIQLIARMPALMAYSYQVKRRNFYGKSMYIHPIKPTQTTAECILNSIRSNKQFTEDEALLLDTCLMLHAEHGGGNNSSFATRVVTSSGTDTYSAIAAGIGALKGPRHGGANLKVAGMVEDIMENAGDYTDDSRIEDYLYKIINKEAFDHSGLIYGMGHAVYTLSDPRAKILKKEARNFAEKTGMMEEYNVIEAVERLTPEIYRKSKGINKNICANVDLYSGFIYKMLGIPQDLFTPLFATARLSGWLAHRIEEITTGKKIIRPAYKSVVSKRDYIKLDDRANDYKINSEYIPASERIEK